MANCPNCGQPLPERQESQKWVPAGNNASAAPQFVWKFNTSVAAAAAQPTFRNFYFTGGANG